MIDRPIIDGIPAPQGPYVPVVRVDNLLFLSGQGPIDPKTNQFMLGSVEQQTQLVMDNIGTILSSCNASWGDIVKCSVFLADANDFAAMNRVYATYFLDHKPTRTTIASILVVPGMKVEIDCIAYCPLNRPDEKATYVYQGSTS